MTIARRIPTLATLLLTALLGCDAGPAPTRLAAAAPATQAAAPAPEVASCRTCHAGPMSFAGKDSHAVAASLRAIVAGDRPHPPLQLGDTSDAALAALAQRLTSGSP